MKQTLKHTLCVILFVFSLLVSSNAQVSYNVSQSLDSLLEGNSKINFSISNFSFKTSFVEVDSTAAFKSMGASFRRPDNFSIFFGNLNFSGIPKYIQKPQISLSNSISHYGIILKPISFSLTDTGYYEKAGFSWNSPVGSYSVYAEHSTQKDIQAWFLYHYNFNISNIFSSISFFIDYSSINKTDSSWYITNKHFYKQETLYPSVIFSIKSKYFFLSVWGLALHGQGTSVKTALKTEFSIFVNSFNFSFSSYNESKEYIASKNTTHFPLQYAFSIKDAYTQKTNPFYTFGFDLKSIIELKPETEWYIPYTKNESHAFKFFFYLFDSEWFYTLKIQNNEYCHSYKLTFSEIMHNKAELSLKLDKTVSSDIFTVLFSIKPHKKFYINSQFFAEPTEETITYRIENQITCSYSINSIKCILQLNAKHQNDPNPEYIKISNTIMY